MSPKRRKGLFGRSKKEKKAKGGNEKTKKVGFFRRNKKVDLSEASGNSGVTEKGGFFKKKKGKELHESVSKASDATEEKVFEGTDLATDIPLMNVTTEDVETSMEVSGGSGVTDNIGKKKKRRFFKKKKGKELHESVTKASDATEGKVNEGTDLAPDILLMNVTTEDVKSSMEVSIFKGDECFKLGKYSDAMTHYEFSLDETIKKYDLDDIRVALVYGRMAKVILASATNAQEDEKGVLERAKDLFDRTMKILERKLGESHDETVLVQKDIDAIDDRIKQLLATPNRDIDESEIGIKSARNLNIEGSTVNNDNDTISLIKHYSSTSADKCDEEVISTLENALQKIMPDIEHKAALVFDALVTLGNIYYYQGQESFNKAFGCYKGALLVSDKCEAEIDWNRKVLALSNMGRICNDYGDILSGSTLFDECFIIYRSQTESSRKTLEFSCLLNNAGNIAFKLCQFDLAKEYYTESLNIKMDILGENHLSIIGMLTNMGMVYLEKNDMNEALRQFEDARVILEASAGVVSKDLAIACINLGNAYRILSNTDAAKMCFNVIIKSAEYIGQESAEVLTAKILLGYIAFSEGQYDEALSFYDGCLTESIGSSQKYMILYGKGNTFVKKNDFDNALKSYEEALKFGKDTHSYRGVSKTLQNIGNIHRKLRNFDKAQECFEEAKISRDTLGDVTNVVDNVKLHIDMGKLQMTLKNYIGAHKYFVEAESLLKEAADFPGTRNPKNQVMNLVTKSTTLANI